ncbi:MAG: DUF1800 family protein [Ktedonobacterales bacterium]
MSNTQFPPDDPRAPGAASPDDAVTRPLTQVPSQPGWSGEQWPSETPTMVSDPRASSPQYWQPPSAPAAVEPIGPATPRAARSGFSRRKLLVGAGAGALTVGALATGFGFYLHRGSNGGIPSLFATDAGQVMHLLRRAGFGPSPDDIGTYLGLGVSGSMDRLLNYSSVADNLDARLNALKLNFAKVDDVVRWWVLRMLYSQHPLEEKLTLFWHGVLTSSFTKVGGTRGYPLLIQQNQLLRTHAMGRFDDLIHAIAIDPAMLVWLDGNKSTGKSPNENFARELMELFTLGLTDASGKPNYTQNDVHQGALALTGWHTKVAGGKATGVFSPARHFSGSVTYLGHSGAMGLADVVKLVCAHPSTGNHLAFRMWSFFVSENPSASDLKPLADAYYASNHSIRAMVEAMLKSPAFFSPAAYRARVKSPVEFVVGAVRGLGLSSDATGVSGLLAPMGQVPFDPPDVSGWNGDKVSAAWVSTGSWMTRVNFINTLVAAASGLPVSLGGAPVKKPGAKQAGGSGTAATSTAGVAGSALQQLIHARQIASPTALAGYFIAALLDNHLDADRQAAVHDAINAHASGPTLAFAGGTTAPAASVRDALYLVMSMPEYQMN